MMRHNFPNEIICELGEVILYPNQLMSGVTQKRLPLKGILRYRYNHTDLIIFCCLINIIFKSD